jgi:CRISPR-associated protein Cmr2
MTTRYFHFTLGPVQGFVAQARRTRDFWAGSFILSWLAAVAMRSVQKQQGEIVFPFPDKNYLNWLEGHGKKSPPRQGNVPNRFKAKVNDDFSPQQVVDNVQTAWRELAELVWKGDLESFCDNNSIHRQIWDRQINHFFEMTWVLTENNQVANLLDRRKNWRNHFAPAEPGVKCMTMEGWQELSGMPTPDRKQQETFWQQLRNNLSPSKMDLAEQETLCAIAFVK